MVYLGVFSYFSKCVCVCECLCVCVCVSVTWLTHSTGVVNSWLRRCSVDEMLSICLVLSSQSEAWNSHLNRAATESMTSRRTRPRVRRRGTRRDRHTWSESCRDTKLPSACVGSVATWREAGGSHQVGGVLHVHAVGEPKRVDERWRHVGAQTGLFSDQLLQTPDGERVLRADEDGSCRQAAAQEAFRGGAERRKT